MDAAEDFAWYGTVSKHVQFLKKTIQRNPQAILWLLQDENQVVYNLAIGSGPKPGQELHAAVRLTNVYRTTGNINVIMRLSEEDLPFKKAIPSPDLHLTRVTCATNLSPIIAI